MSQAGALKRINKAIANNASCLDLSRLNLASVPAELSQLRSLRELFLSSNKLTSVPAELGQLQSLSLLDLSSNKLASVPTELGQLHNLRELYFRPGQYSLRLQSTSPNSNERGVVHFFE